MPLIKRSDLARKKPDDLDLEKNQIILLCGERYLCKKAADHIEKMLLDGGGTVHLIDGDTENPEKILARVKSFSLLPGRQVYRVVDCALFHSRTVAADIWKKAVAAAQAKNRQTAMRHIVALAGLGVVATESETPFSELEPTQWQDGFDFTKPSEDLSWADRLLIEARGTGRLNTTRTGSIVDRYIEAFSSAIPPANFLLLLAETVDKRQKLFTFIKKNGLVVDCSVATGAAKAAQNEQKEVLREMVVQTLREFDKDIAPDALEIFFERVGFHPVAMVRETEKLALFVDDRQRITTADVNEMVARTREDALFELTDAFGKNQVSRTLTILQRLQDNSIHPLAILATMRNYLRKLLILRSIQLQPEPSYYSQMNARQFQNEYLPALKKNEQYSEYLKGHPYALFMSFSQAAKYSCSHLKKLLCLLLEAEYRLKGSQLPQRIILEELFLTMFLNKTTD